MTKFPVVFEDLPNSVHLREPQITKAHKFAPSRLFIFDK